MIKLVPTSEDTYIYEVCILYPATLSQKEEQEVVKAVEEIFADAGGRLVDRDLWGTRGLAYPIRKQHEGKFVVYFLELDPLKVSDMDHQIRIIPNMLRHMIIRPPKDYEVIHYSELYEKWMKERKTHVETRQQEEEKRLQQKVVEKARRDVRRKETQKKEDEQKVTPVAEKEIKEQLEKIIADDTLDL